MNDIISIIKELVEFYPIRIRKEGKHFFTPYMGYFSKQEQSDMRKEFWEFDKNLIHEKYKDLVEQFENKTGVLK